MSRDMLEDYCNRLTDYLLSFNRGMVAETLFALEEQLYNGRDDIHSVKLLLTDLYLSIKENVRLTYNTVDIPFPANTEAMSHISECLHLYEIIRYISEMMEDY